LTDPTSGISIAVPSTFKSIDASTIASGANNSQLSDLSPEIAPFLSAGNAFLDRAAIAAVDEQAFGGTFIVVGKSPQRIDVNDESFASAIENQFSSLGIASDVTTDQIDLPAGPALRIGVTLSFGGASASGLDVGETLFFVNAAGQTFVIVGASFPADTTGVFDDIAQTFSVTQ
jgi:hypothetical protein